MEERKLFDIINKVIDEETKCLVGILCKRIEVLEKENSLSPNLYKSLTKENLYEYARRLKKLLDLYIRIGRIEFKNRPQDRSV